MVSNLQEIVLKVRVSQVFTSTGSTKQYITIKTKSVRCLREGKKILQMHQNNYGSSLYTLVESRL